MRHDRLLGLGLAFILGACATTAVRRASIPAAHAGPMATVVGLDAAPSARAPTGKAQVWHLARGDNAYLGRLEMAPGAAVPEHQDETEEYIHILEGTGTMMVDGQRHEVGPGTTIYMPAHAKVSFENGDARLVGLQVFAGPAPAKKYDKWTPVSE